MLTCIYCSKNCKNENSHRNHQRLCPSNSERIYKNGMTGKTGTNQYAKGVSMTEETKKKIGLKSKGRVMSAATKLKLSIARSKWLSTNGDIYRKNRKPSYMESTFTTWLTALNVEFKTEVHFRDKTLNKNYFVDFLFEDKKLIIELDGNQHEKRKEFDGVRDAFLTSLGYQVIRITHAEYKAKSRIDEIKSLCTS